MVAVRIIGNIPTKKRIGDMKPGDTGYTVPWAYNTDTGELNQDFTLCEKGGTASLWVECVKPGTYVIEFEEPEYRDIFGARNE